MSLDIKTFRPRKRISIYLHRCQECLETVLHSQVAESHGEFKEGCQGKLELGGNFILIVEYTAPSEMRKKFMYKDEDGEDIIRNGELAIEKIVGWDGLTGSGKELKFSKDKIESVLEAIPGLIDIVWLLSVTRSFFSLPDLEAFSKNLNGRSSTRTSTQMEANQVPAENA